jgi:ATP-binding cassette, subfamily B, bacterial
MTYNLNITNTDPTKRTSTWVSLRKLAAILANEKKNLFLALFIVLINASLFLTGPFLIGRTIDKYVVAHQYHGVLRNAGILFLIYLTAFATAYYQAKLMGGIGQRLLYNMRNDVFSKLQELPIAFFNENKAGDLISRINNDTDKINQFFAQSLVQFMASIFTMTGAGIFLLSINPVLGGAALIPAVLILVFTRVVSPWVKNRNAKNLASTGNLSAEIQEILANFKVVVAYDRRDYFRKKFSVANRENYRSATRAGVANNLFMPVYTFFANSGQLIVLVLGIYMISTGSFTIGLLISFLSYVSSFYNPLRQLAALWTNFQIALAGWDRISMILKLENNLLVKEGQTETCDQNYIVFRHVSFTYPNGKEVLHNVSFELERSKTYALVGPTGGGKTTTASLMARLYDPTRGRILLDGKDLKSYSPAERTRKIGFILQDPILFSGNVRENLVYGHDELSAASPEDLLNEIQQAGLGELLERFEKGLDTPVQSTGDTISLGQKQLIAFMRAVLRKPELLILDEATANIDTITEQQLETILRKLPESTTRIIIAHRLNTIENADEIFFVNSNQVLRAGSMDEAVDLLMHHKGES